MSGHKAWGDFKSTVPLMAAPHHAMPHQIHVLLVDHNTEELIQAARLLEACQYRVTYIEYASAACSIISAGKARCFDVVIADINAPDLHGHKLLQCSVGAELPIVLMSAEDSMFMASRAIESGAFMYVKKPLSFDVAKYMWQHVVRERRIQMIHRNPRLSATTMMNNNFYHQHHHELLHHGQENPNSINNIGGMMMMGERNGSMAKNSRRRSNGLMNGYDEEAELGDSMNQGNNNVKKKTCTEWTHELHSKFIDAVEKLGEGRCFPKEILELMNVPGLTRMQVASHLQKCRNNNWRAPEERKRTDLGGNSSVRMEGFELSLSLPRRFGSKPVMARPIPFNLDPNIASSSRVKPPPSDDFFNFPAGNLESLINSFSGIQQGETSNANQAHGGGYNHEQNYGVASMEMKSHWSPEASGDSADQKKGHK